MCECKVGPGKFEGEPVETFIAHGWGPGDSSTGGINEGDSVEEWFAAPLTPSVDDKHQARAYGYCDKCIENAFAGINGGIVVWENEQGFAYAETFKTKVAFEDALAMAESDDAESSEGEN